MGGRGSRLRISTACTWFFSRVRCLTNWRRRESSRRNAAVSPSGAHTSPANPLANNLASARASILSVFAASDSCTALGSVNTTRATCGRNNLAIGNAFAVASSTSSAAGPRLSANSVSASGVVRTRPAERTRPCSTIATSQKSR